MKQTLRLVAASTALSCVLASGNTRAQDTAGSEGQATPAASEAGIDEIVVTAQRRTELLRDVPVSVTAIGGNTITENRIARANELTVLVPNLQTVGAVGDSQPIFSLRGVSMNDYSLNQSGPVATYYDEVYKGNFAILGIALYDLERVEVLRGPQGTLYGKNTTGGAVNLISKVPTFETGGYLNAGFGNYNRYEAEGAVQFPLSDNIAARVAFTFARANGWYKNLLPGQPDQQAVRQWGGRATILFNASDRLTFTLRASTSLENPVHDAIYGDVGEFGIGAGVYGFYNSLNPVFNPQQEYFRGPGMKRRETESNNVVRRRNRNYAISLNTRYELTDALDLISITSYDKGNFFYEEDTDGSPLKAIEQAYTDRAKQITQDLRIASSGSGAFKFLVGGYLHDERVFNLTTLPLFQDIDANLDGQLNSLDCEAAFPIGCDIHNQFKQKKRSYAAYTDMSYLVTDQLTVRGGIRYTHDRGRLRNFKSQLFGSDGVLLGSMIPGGPDPDGVAGLSYSNNNLSGKIGVDYKTAGGTLLYLNYSRGYRGRSFNGQAFFAPDELTIARPEKVSAVEVGFKLSALGGGLQINGAAFHYSYKDQQLLDVDPVTASQRLVNLDKSRIIGAELEVVARPTSRLTLNGGIGLLDSKILTGSLVGVNIRGNELVSAPHFNVALAAKWVAVDADWGTVTVHGDGNYTSKRYFDLFNRPSTTQNGYALINGRIGWESVNGNYGLAVWAKNITNKFYATSLIDILSGFGLVYSRIGQPRTYGVTAEVRF